MICIMCEPASDPLALPAFIIAIGAAVIALFSASWSVVSWFWDGARVRARATLRPRHDGDMVYVYVWNRGRSSVDIIEVTVERDPASLMVPLLGIDDPGMPFTLSPGKAQAFDETYLPDGDYYGAKSYTAVITLATGRIIRARAKVR